MKAPFEFLEWWGIVDPFGFLAGWGIVDPICFLEWWGIVEPLDFWMRVGHFPLNALERLLCLGRQSLCGQGWVAFKSPMVLSVGPVDDVGGVYEPCP